MRLKLFPGGCRVILLCLGLLLSGAEALFAGTYFNSAHGNTGCGVNRSATAAIGYTKGHCGHCHEQHASIDGEEPNPAGGSASKYAIFADNFTSQTEGFCYYCHKGAGSVQVSFERTNYNYSYWFGGNITLATPNNIYDAFNPVSGSSHNLQDVLDFVKTKWPDTFGNESNPCNACHNPHLSTRGYPIVRPTDRNNIWGDSAGEKMSDYAAAHGGQYQAPYRYNSTNTYEPDASATTDGSNLPDYVTFCSDCHNATNVIYSSNLIRNVNGIGWSETARTYNLKADYHGSVTRCWGVDGMVDATCGTSGDPPVPTLRNWGSIKDPYLTANYINFILCCTDCHEPHGSPNPFLIRKSVNGADPAIWSSINSRAFCQCCHVHNAHCGNLGSCLNCHAHNAYARCWACTWCVGGVGGASGHSF
ncbi:MAG: cytochrome c3 family protein [Desulfovibrionales bacterium]|nr:cytochrome c3 family protein [Desulfovibrionales bacterium]